MTLPPTPPSPAEDASAPLRWADQIRDAAAAGRALRIHGSDSKAFYGRAVSGDPLDVRPYRGVLAYEPSELVITARAGTPLTEIEATLAAAGQMLAFDPPHFGPGATLGGCVAAGLAGPARLAAGGVRDYLLGAELLDGRGVRMRFGGQVMKNVAGYDVSRLLAGSLGTLGVLLEISLKVLPLPRALRTLQFSCDEASAITRLNQWGGQPLPIQASAWQPDEAQGAGVLSLRLAGAESAVAAAARQLGGEAMAEPAASAFWHAVREHQDPRFQALGGDQPLWRIAVPSTTPPLRLPGQMLLSECGGGLRWLASPSAASEIRAQVAACGGHASLFRGGERDGEVFSPLSAPMLRLQQRLKQAFDPAGIFNPGRMYSGL